MQTPLRPSLSRCVLALGAVLLSPGLWLQAQAPEAIAAASATVVDGARQAWNLNQAGGTGTVTGTVHDSTDAVVPGASVTVTGEDPRLVLRATTAEDGSFALASVPSGRVRIRVAETGFLPWTGSALVGAGEHLVLTPVALSIDGNLSTVEVRATGHDIAEAQMQLEEHQRVLGVFPNFYATYASNPEPLSAGQKWRLAWRFSNDPVAFAMAGVIAGAQQKGGSFQGYGTGPNGYARRLGATYADGLTSTFLGGALLPMLFHQDPRYLVKGTGSVPSRTLYALASTVMCKGDNRHWQVNASNILGNLASAGLSNAYYPSAQRGASLLVQNGLTATAMGAIGGLFQEFLLHRMTPHLPADAEGGR